MAKLDQKKIIQASDAELRDFAELTLQLDLAGATNRHDIEAKIKSTWPQDFILVEVSDMPDVAEDQDDSARAQARQRVGGLRYQDDPKCLVLISATELPGGKDPVPVGCNGDIVVLQRGMEIELPYRFLGVLLDAVRISVSQDPKTLEFSYSKFTNYPLQVLERPSKQEIAEFKARTQNEVLLN